LIPEFSEGNFYTFFVSILSGAVMGAVIGVLQGGVLARRFGLDGWRDFTLASMLGGALRWALLSPLISTLLTIRTGWKGAADVTDICLIFLALIIFGALSGIVFGIPQAIVMKRHIGEATELDVPAWAMANALGGVFNIPFISLSGLNSAAVSAMLGVAAGESTQIDKVLIAVAITWAIIALATTIPLADKLRAATK
jgi:hypothetical protein